MKHTWRITFFLVLVFLCAQAVGLTIINQYVDIDATKETGKTVVNTEAYNITGITPPEVANESISWIYIMFAVLVGTVIVLVIIKFRKRTVWKAWFFLSVIICLVIALAPFIDKALALAGLARFAFYLTIAIALVLTFYKVVRPNIIVHNMTEVFIYGGLAALIVPVMNMVSAVAVLIAISIYDMIAVWRSKHMVTMAKFQAESQMFAGLFIPYHMPKKGQKMVLHKPDDEGIDAEASEAMLGTPNVKRARTGNSAAMKLTTKGTSNNTEIKSAILGGGDIAFPLLFSGVIMKTTASFIAPAIITVCTAVALFLLLYKGESNKFYPAMPFISAGCFLGWLVVWLVGLY
jgi:presenilin-like A22 family membrane protease